MRVLIFGILASFVVALYAGAITIKAVNSGNNANDNEKSNWGAYKPVLVDVKSDICGDDGNFPNPLDCHTFYKCSNGNRYLMFCPDDLVWDDEAQICVWDDGSPCDYQIHLHPFKVRK